MTLLLVMLFNVALLHVAGLLVIKAGPSRPTTEGVAVLSRFIHLVSIATIVAAMKVVAA